MRRIAAAVCVVLGSAVASTQSLAPRPPVAQYVTVEASANVDAAPPGGVITLWADVTPKRNIHVYAPGAKDFAPVSLVPTPNSRVAFGKSQLPAGRPMVTIGSSDRVPVYADRFRITQPITLNRSVVAGERLTIAAALNYQACDDAVCYPATSIPLIWTVVVK
jgi:hypothetical protein